MGNGSVTSWKTPQARAPRPQDVAFTFPSRDRVTAILVNARLLDAGTIQYEGYVRDGRQTLVLNQELVRAPESGRKGRRWLCSSERWRVTAARLAAAGSR